VQGYLTESLLPFEGQQELEQHLSGEPHPDVVDTYWEDEIEVVRKEEVRSAHEGGEDEWLEKNENNEKEGEEGVGGRGKKEREQGEKGPEVKFVIKRRSHRFLGQEDLSDWGSALEASLTGRSRRHRKQRATQLSSSGPDAGSQAGLSLEEDSDSDTPAEAQTGAEGDCGTEAAAEEEWPQEVSVAYDIISARTGEHPADSRAVEAAPGVDLEAESWVAASEGETEILRKAMSDAAFLEEVRACVVLIVMCQQTHDRLQ
jgi:hypothetical protein